MFGKFVLRNVLYSAAAAAAAAIAVMYATHHAGCSIAMKWCYITF